MSSDIPDPKDQRDRPTYSHSNGDDLLSYFKNHARETISYILMILGLLLLFYLPLYGGLLVGIVGGIYFGDEIVNYIKNWKTSIDSKNRYSDVARQLILAGLAIAFFICAPAIFLGAALSIGIKQLFVGQDVK
jgi:hypothetical protein